MRIAITHHSLKGLGGTETYVSTIGDVLQRDGHEVWLYAPERGKGSELAEEFGLRVVTSVHDLPADLDVAIPQDAPSTLDVLAVYPELPQIFVSHTELFDVGLPPQVVGALKAVVTLYDRAHNRVLAQSIQVPVERLRQPVDIERFKPLSQLPDKPRTARSFGNYLTGERLRVVERACELAGIEFSLGGASSGELELRPEYRLNEVDIVFGKAKVIHEAMGCGRAAYVLDHNGAEGWVTAENYETLVADNFGGRTAPRPFDAESLAADLGNYDPAMGLVNRDLIVAHHDAIAHTAGLMEIVRRHVDDPGPRPDPANVAELAQLTRIAWKHQGEAFQLRNQIEAKSLQMGDAMWRAEVAEAELAAARQDAENIKREYERRERTLPTLKRLIKQVLRK
ncbi:MAG: hypothetical protein JHD02_09510 [Thermoleophilaceae bacterium]|nr:hypothetical protein [Thermoleophilaceae bacterium]